MMEWISIYDRLPNFGQRALCYTKFSGELVLCFGDDSRWRDLEDCLYDVLCWMPLPQPPSNDEATGGIFECGYGETAEEDGWNDPHDNLPKDSTPVLALGIKQGTVRATTAQFIHSRGWINYWTGKSMPIKYWRKMPILPEGVKV